MHILELAFLSKSDVIDTRRIVREVDEGALQAASKVSSSVREGRDADILSRSPTQTYISTPSFLFTERALGRGLL